MAFWVQNHPCSQTMAFWEYRARKKGLYVVARNSFLLLLNCSAWTCLAVAQHNLHTFILGPVLFSRMLPVRKPWHFGSTLFQNAPCSETMAFWEYCFPECSLFVYYKSGGILEKLPPSKKEQNWQNQCIMLNIGFCQNSVSAE